MPGYTALSNDGNSTGRIQFFGNFTNSGILVPNAGNTGSVGTASNPWSLMTAHTMNATNVNATSIVAASVSKLGGNFRIDHPLDPFNKYPQHSFVKSPDMKNVYDGIATLDKRGEAWGSLPDWFQTLNSDFRYQLTSVGSPAPNLFVAEEMSDNKFKIAGGKPGSKISWQVTGIRQDAWAKDNRIQVEVEKTLDQRGKYLYQGRSDPQSKEAAVSPVSGTVSANNSGKE